MKLIRPYLAIMLAVLFFYNTLGYYFVFRLMQVDVRNEMKSYIKEHLKESEFELITITTDDTQSGRIKFVNDNEFYFNDKLYDIIKAESNENSTTYYCINDKKEEQLLENLNKQIITQNDISKSLNGKYHHIFSGMIKDVVFSDLDFSIHLSSTEPVYYFTHFPISDLTKGVIPHPPSRNC